MIKKEIEKLYASLKEEIPNLYKNKIIPENIYTKFRDCENFKNKTFEDLLLPLAFVGGFLFLLLWEAKSQYALYFYPALFIYSILGYKELLYMDRNRFKALIFYLVITFSLFALTMEKSLVIDNTKYNEYVSYGNSYEWFRNNKWFVWER